MIYNTNRFGLKFCKKHMKYIDKYLKESAEVAKMQIELIWWFGPGPANI